MRIKLWETREMPGNQGIRRMEQEPGVELCKVSYTQKNPHACHCKNVYKHVDNVDNYF